MIYDKFTVFQILKSHFKSFFPKTRLKDPLRGSKPYGTETQIGTDAQNGTETQSGTDAHFSKGTYAHLLTKKSFH